METEETAIKNVETEETAIKIWRQKRQKEGGKEASGETDN